MKSPIKCSCEFCGVDFYKSLHDIKRTPRNFCSRKCSGKFKAKRNTDNFYTRCEKTQTCWNWTGNLNMHGYGYAMFKGKVWIAHRYSYFLSKGDIPEGMEVLHSCDNRKCVNPDHLSIGTHMDNMIDMIRKGRHAHILSNQTKIKIANSNKSTSELALSFGVSERTIRNVRTKGAEHWARMLNPAAER